MFHPQGQSIVNILFVVVQVSVVAVSRDASGVAGDNFEKALAQLQSGEVEHFCS